MGGEDIEKVTGRILAPIFICIEGGGKDKNSSRALNRVCLKEEKKSLKKKIAT